MDFEIKNIQDNIVVVARKLGYVIIDTKKLLTIPEDEIWPLERE